MGASKATTGVDKAPTYLENSLGRIISHNERMYSLIHRLSNLKAKFHGVEVPTSKGQEIPEPTTMNDKFIVYLDEQAKRIEELGDLIQSVEEII